MGNRQGAEGSGTLGVDRTLRDAFAVLVSELFDELVVLKLKRSARTGGFGILVVGDRVAGGGGELGILWHDSEIETQNKS